MEPTPLSPVDLVHLGRCVDLARGALEAGDGDQTRHLEIDLARWAAAHVASTAQFVRWRHELGLARGPILALPITAVAPDLPVAGPVEELAQEVRELFRRSVERAPR